MMQSELYAPQSYKDATREEVEATIGSGGCGAGDGWGDRLVPDTMWGLSVQPACEIHDWMYHHGKTIADKEEADRVFLNNLLRLIESETRWVWLRMLRRRRALKYYEAVHAYGGPAYWNGKNQQRAA